MRHGIVIGTLMAGLLAAGCHRDNGGGIGAVPGGFPPRSSPAAVSSSEQVVKVTTTPAQIAAGSAGEAIIQLAITPGYHINANPATFPYLIATEVVPEKTEGIVAAKPVYPPGEKRNFQFEKEPLAVYQGETQIKVPITADAKATAGRRSLPISVRVQACDDEKCFPPASISSTIPIEVK